MKTGDQLKHILEAEIGALKYSLLEYANTEECALVSWVYQMMGHRET